MNKTSQESDGLEGLEVLGLGCVVGGMGCAITPIAIIVIIGIFASLHIVGPYVGFAVPVICFLLTFPGALYWSLAGFSLASMKRKHPLAEDGKGAELVPLLAWGMGYMAWLFSMVLITLKYLSNTRYIYINVIHYITPFVLGLVIHFMVRRLTQRDRHPYTGIKKGRMIEISCVCGKRVQAPPDKVGKRGRCPFCGAVTVVRDPFKRGSE